MNRYGTRFRAGALAAILPLAACSDFFDVQSPGTIPDENLNSRDAVESLVVGMSYDMASAMDGSLEFLSLASGDLWDSGSYGYGEWARGIWDEDDINGEWATMHQARWVAEDGIRRIQADPTIMSEEEFYSSPLIARAHVFAGIANRQLGENMCVAVIDGGPAQDRSVHFSRAESYFDTAIQIATAAGDDELLYAAYGGRASVRAWQGDWAGAVADASMVPDDFVYYAFVEQPYTDNNVAYETHVRYEYTVYNTEFASHYGDPRIPWDTLYTDDGEIQTGANGATPVFQQNKYPSQNSDIPLVKGTEMLVLRAEAELRNGASGIPAATALLNRARAVYGMAELAEPATLEEAWDILHYERSATVWLEGRRLWDLSRWFAAGPGDPSYHPFLEGRATCIPISKEERDANENF
ncbi:MAG TPA: RagB/SusD family nutrient uptake outer membrane protein [Longimicrobiales bacterium]